MVQLHLEVLEVAILYVGLLFLWIWRWLFPWRTSKHWQYLNYQVLLYTLICGLYGYELVIFVLAAMKDLQMAEEASRASHPLHPPSLMSMFGNAHQENWPVMWLRVMVIGAPAVVFVTIVLCWTQSREHLREISNDVAVDRHDRALNIIATPAVYSVMTLSAMVRVYDLVINQWEEKDMQRQSDAEAAADKAMAIAKYETCFYVGDLYEAWALYQFGRLTIELLRPSIGIFDEPESPTALARMHSARTQGTVSKVALVDSVEAVMWVGTGMFIAVNLVQAAWCLYLWICKDPATDWEHYEGLMDKFKYAGLVASAGAIYNVHTVESSLGHFIIGYSPFFKFLSVKLLVFFAFWQRPVLQILVYFKVLTLAETQLQLFQASLITLECLLGAIMNLAAWRVREVWYVSPDASQTPEEDEKTRLLDAGAARAL